MNMTLSRSNALLLVGAVAAMALTRSHHLSNVIALPDASLALFFLAGWLMAGVTAFGVLLVAAVAIDLFAINVGGVSGFCITAAYPFLALAYGAMWWGGRLIRRHSGRWNQRAALLAVSAAVSTLIAYAVSEMSFFWFSGQVKVALAEYLATATQYLPAYMMPTLSYIALGTLITAVVSVLSTTNQRPNQTI